MHLFTPQKRYFISPKTYLMKYQVIIAKIKFYKYIKTL